MEESRNRDHITDHMFRACIGRRSISGRSIGGASLGKTKSNKNRDILSPGKCKPTDNEKWRTFEGEPATLVERSWLTLVYKHDMNCYVTHVERHGDDVEAHGGVSDAAER